MRLNSAGIQLFIDTASFSLHHAFAATGSLAKTLPINRQLPQPSARFHATGPVSTVSWFRNNRPRGGTNRPMETLISFLIGLGLSAACGFRVFVPLLLLGITARAGHLSLAGGFEWIASDPALIAFAVATVFEVAGYFIPWLDHLLDTLAAPAAVVAGSVTTAALVTDLNPFLQWSLAIIAGGGVAGLIKGTTIVARGTSTLASGGLTNPLLATAELGGSLTMALMAIFIPAAILVLLLIGALWIGWRLIRRRAATRSNLIAPM
jgi:hypothetical protein